MARRACFKFHLPTGAWSAWLDRKRSNSLPFEQMDITDWAYLKAEWPKPPHDEWLPLQLLSSSDAISDGVCLMVAPAMVQFARALLGNGGVGRSGRGLPI